MAEVYQALQQGKTGQVRGIPLRGAQEGLVLTVTSQDCIIHWLSSIIETNSTRPVSSTKILPYQEGKTIDENTEVNYGGDNVSCGAVNTREVLMIRQPRSPLNPPRRPDYRSSDEAEADIPPDSLEGEGETDN